MSPPFLHREGATATENIAVSPDATIAGTHIRPRDTNMATTAAIPTEMQAFSEILTTGALIALDARSRVRADCWICNVFITVGNY